MVKISRNDRLIPLHDYGPALRSAVSWLGERYLLAQPEPRRTPVLFRPAALPVSAHSPPGLR